MGFPPGWSVADGFPSVAFRPSPAGCGSEKLVGTLRLSSPRFLGWAAVAGVGTAIVIFIVISAAGPSAAVVTMPAPAFGPPWWFSLHLTLAPVLIALWAAAIIGAAGTAAGLVAVRLGARP